MGVYTCTNANYKTACCKTCQQARSACRDQPNCARTPESYCRYINIANDCPIRCKAVQRTDMVCPGNGGGSGGSGGNPQPRPGDPGPQPGVPQPPGGPQQPG